MERLHLVKMHGARNDFILLDRRRDGAIEDMATLARTLCDRRGGIGADGLLLVESSALADAAMRIFNADGSEAEMCGNGMRCVARYLDETGAGAAQRIETEAGLIETRIVQREPEYLVRVAVSAPVFVPLDLELEDAHLVVVGNPHVVLMRRSSDEVALVATARALQSSPAFPEGVNVHVATVEGDRVLHVSHWERGVGLTQACGTGSVACAVVAMRKSLVRSPVEVRVPGGTLRVEWDGDDGAYLTGPAERVFDTNIVV